MAKTKKGQALPTVPRGERAREARVVALRENPAVAAEQRRREAERRLPSSPPPTAAELLEVQPDAAPATEPAEVER